MNRYVSLSVFLCSSLLVITTPAQAIKKFDISVDNDAQSSISLSQATWHLGNYAAVDYQIPQHFNGEFLVTVAGEKSGSLSFTYVAGSTACTYQAKYGPERVAGWLWPSYVEKAEARGISVGQFGALCDATVVEKTSGDGYNLRVSIK
ncbi:hypothetical protein NLO98_14810 [Pseudomonas syringae]|nr:hypothetical protein [Pseudomonas syringae]